MPTHEYQELEEGGDGDRLAGRADLATVCVSIPPGAKPGDQLQANTPEGVKFAFSVPPGCKPGQLLRVEIPKQAKKQDLVVKVTIPAGVRCGDSITAVSPEGITFKFEVPAGSAPGDTILVAVPESAGTPAPGQVPVKLPDKCSPGQTLRAQAPDGTKFEFVVPPEATPGNTILVALPSIQGSSANRKQEHDERGAPAAAAQMRQQLRDVSVPQAPPPPYDAPAPAAPPPAYDAPSRMEPETTYNPMGMFASDGSGFETAREPATARVV